MGAPADSKTAWPLCGSDCLEGVFQSSALLYLVSTSATASGNSSLGFSHLVEIKQPTVRIRRVPLFLTDGACLGFTLAFT